MTEVTEDLIFIHSISKSVCHGLSVFPSNSYVESLTPTVLVFKDGALEGGVVMMALNGLELKQRDTTFFALSSKPKGLSYVMVGYENKR